jgi:hypothetical protein
LVFSDILEGPRGTIRRMELSFMLALNDIT